MILSMVCSAIDSSTIGGLASASQNDCWVFLLQNGVRRMESIGNNSGNENSAFNVSDTRSIDIGLSMAFFARFMF